VNLAELCPACSTLVTVTTYAYKDGDDQSDFYHCPNCTFLFARPVLIPELDSRQMDGIDNAELFNSRLLKSIYINYFIKKEIRFLRRIAGKGPLHMLDIGCGTGWTTRVYADHGFSITGLEPSQVRGDYARQHYGIDVVCAYMENAEFDKRFDVVVLRHIIEHFADPAAIIDKIRSFLKPDGLVLVVVPNIDCVGRRLFETDWEWVLPWHCNFFNSRSANRLLTEQGFNVKTAYQTASPLYYPGAIKRKFPHRLVKWLLGNNRVAAMTLCAPLAIGGKLFGMGDNLNIIASRET
jgi:2-polyprenyl-3-methyl-5-hydroxy-6-metoxy-1,4-benzoquinol methylase